MVKICANPECKKKQFEPKSSKAVYCSPACKSRHQYLKKQSPSVEKTQDEPPKMEKGWSQDISVYCSSNGVYPNDLIDFHRTYSRDEVIRAIDNLKKAIFNSKK